MAIDPAIPAAKFLMENEIESIKEFGDGNIHKSFYVKTKGRKTSDYLLQLKNKNVFRDVPSMMDNISAVSEHLKKKVEEKDLDPLRYTLNIVPTKAGKLYFQDEEGEYWAASVFIKDSRTYSIPQNKSQVIAGGMATGDFHNMMADFNEPLVDILPGFHNLRYRFKQWDKVIDKLSGSKKSEYQREIDWIEGRRESIMNFREKIENGTLPLRVAHNDAKLLNVLFDQYDNVLCLIDLDTVLYGSVLYDFGDAIRSYTNTGAEDDLNPEKVKIDMAYFEAFAEGYLKEAKSFLNPAELEGLAFSARYITFEQTLRFLMDYLEGSPYYKISYPDHNLVRARAQYALLRDMENNYEQMQNIVEKHGQASLS